MKVKKIEQLRMDDSLPLQFIHRVQNADSRTRSNRIISLDNTKSPLENQENVILTCLLNKARIIS